MSNTPRPDVLEGTEGVAKKNVNGVRPDPQLYLGLEQAWLA
jgi:hypothetical protein